MKKEKSRFIITMKGASCLYRPRKNTIVIAQITSDNLLKYGYKKRCNAQKAADEMNRIDTPYTVVSLSVTSLFENEQRRKGKCPHCEADPVFCICNQ